MTSKECLERLFDDYEYLIEEYYPRSELIESQLNKTKNNVNKIIQDLERLESLEAKFDAYYELHKQLEKGYDELSVDNEKLIQENRNLKKVIEILKRKMIIVKLRDNEYIIHGNEYITKEQYELLKEVF